MKIQLRKPTLAFCLSVIFTVMFAGHASAQLYWAGTGSNPATAGSGTWDNANMQWSSTFPGYTAAMWDSNIANFNGTGGGTVTLGANINVNDINFSANAGGFTLLNSGANQTLIISGTGITNDSANTQTIENSGGNSDTRFNNGATAANAAITNSGMASFTEFNNNSTAANANITSTAFESATFFHDSATAGNATITNSSIASYVSFYGTSTGGTATLINGAADAFIDISGLTNGGMTAGSIAGAGNLRLGSKSLAVGGNNTSTTFSGVIQDGGTSGGSGGSISKVGTGTLILSGTNTYTGGTNIYEGVLQVDGSIASDTVVKTDGTLAGNGTIYANVENHGIVSPGDSPGTLRVQNDYYNRVDGTFRAEIGGLNEGVDADLLFVHGNIYIDGGTLEVVRTNNFMPLPGDRVTILRTDIVCTRTGEFDVLDPVGWNGLVQPIALYDDPFTVDIGFAFSNTFESQGITRNQRAVGAALDNAFLDNCVPNVIAFEGQVPLADLPATYDLIAPEEMASIYEMGFTQANMQGVNLMQRMDDIRAGSTGFCSSVAVEMPTPSYSKESDGKEVLNKNPAPAFVPAPENRWGIWATGSGQFVNVGDDDDNATGYNLSNGNFSVGIDYRLLHNLAFGIYGGYDAGIANLVYDGRVTTNGGNVGGFATWFSGPFYVDVSGGGTWNDYKTRRAALLGDAIGSTKGAQYDVLGAFGYDWHFGCLNVGPRATFQYTDVNIDHFGERGSLAPLDFPDQDEDSLQSTAGVRATYDLHASKSVIIRPEFSAAWLHEFNDSAYPIDASFFNCPGVFTVYGPNVGRDAAQVRAGASAQLNRAFAIYVYYDGLLGRGNYSSNGVSGGFTWSF